MFKLRVHLPGQDGQESVEVEADSRDIVAWEALGRAGKRPTPRRFADLDDGLMMTDLAELGWFACEREGVAGLPDRPAFVRTVRVELVPPSKGHDENDDENDNESDGEGVDGALVPGRADR